jgi:hypothetical protein
MRVGLGRKYGARRLHVVGFIVVAGAVEIIGHAGSICEGRSKPADFGPERVDLRA